MITLCTILLGLFTLAAPPSPPQGLLDCAFQGNTYVCRGRP